MTPVVVVHGGAGRIAGDLVEPAERGVRAAAAAAQSLLLEKGSAERAVIAAVRVLEDDPTFNAGAGSCMTADGSFEMDAGIMRSRDLATGAVAALPDARDPILVAQAVMDDSPHALLVGAGAYSFARDRGVGRFGRELVWTDKAQRRFEQAKAGQAQRHGQADTVGAVALDVDGNTAVACSTGGVLLKMRGRVGDSPLCGAGFYAAPQLGASCATGVGEAILTHVAAYEVLRRIAEGAGPDAAAQAVCDLVATRPEASCGLIVVTPDGRTGIAHQSRNMSWARAIGPQAIEAGVAVAGGRRL